jgi:hypothetical protein
MVGDLVAEALRTGDVGTWARVENAACARRLAAMADMLERRMAADGAIDREQWCLDNWDSVCAEVGAAQNTSLGIASHQLLLAKDLRERLPRVAEVFATGTIGARMVSAIAQRSALITDPDALAKVDTEIAAACAGWGSLSVAKIEKAIDYWVERYDPDALRRNQPTARDRYVDITFDKEGSGVAWVDGVLGADDGEALDQRLDAIAATVCPADPRPLEQRRSDALAALGHGADRLDCRCENPDCDAATRPPSTVIVHVVAEHKSLPGQTGGATAQSAAIMGGALLPAPLLASAVARGAKVVPIAHPGDAPPESRYRPSEALAWFVRCRDLTCRFPGCDEPAHRCDIDHTVPYPAGPTQAANLKCVCRKHHLCKTFGDWRDQQSPDGTVVWTSSDGHTYTTHPGSRLMFPTLCRPTAPIAPTADVPVDGPNRSLKMPRRSQTRADARRKRIAAQRERNREIRENTAPYFPTRPPPDDDDPPPF